MNGAPALLRMNAAADMLQLCPPQLPGTSASFTGRRSSFLKQPHWNKSLKSFVLGLAASPNSGPTRKIS